MVQLGPLGFGAFVLAITSRGEGVELSEDSSPSVEVGLEHLGLLRRCGGRWDRSDQGYRVGIDGEVVVQSVVEQGE